MNMNTADLIKVRVAAKRLECADIAVFELQAVDGAPLPAFEAGAHVDVHLPGGLVRQYSLCNPPAERHRYCLGVLREPASRGGSWAMHEAVQQGDLLHISPPRNHFPLAAGDAPALLFAGGIGVTPLLCMAEALAAAGRDFRLHYCTRSAARTAFRDRLLAAAYAERVRFHFDDAPAAERLDIGAALAAAAPDSHLYVCGPKGYIEAVLAAARAAGWAENRLHCEFFAAEVAPQAGDTAFDVRLASSGRVVHVAAAQTVVAALAAAGVEVPTSCEQGVCGTCLTRVLEGTPDHRDLYLTEEEQAAGDQFLPCCSRARGGLLVLDL